MFLVILFFFPYSVPLQWFISFCFPALLSVPLYCLLYYWLLVYLLFYLLFNSDASLYIELYITLFCILLVGTSILFLRSWIIFAIIILNVLFHVNCLFPLHLVVLLGLYLFPSSKAYFFTFSFCVTFCICGPTDCRTVLHLVSGIFSLMFETDGEACAAFLAGGAVPAPWWLELGLVLKGRAIWRDVFRGCCGLRKTLGSLFTDRWGCFPALLVVWLHSSQHWRL